MRISVAIIALFFATCASASAADAAPASRPTVLLTRFAQLTETAGTEWIGRAVQEALLTDAARDDAFHVVSDQHPPTTDLATARQLGRDAGADLVVIGGYQQVGSDLRITGQIVDVSNGSIFATLKATATANELIAMEDVLSAQLTRALNRKTQTQPPARQAAIELDTLGPVRLAHYTRPFLQSKNDSNLYYSTRYIYGTPAWSPYFCYWGYGWGCGYAYPFGYGCFNPVVITPRESLPW